MQQSDGTIADCYRRCLALTGRRTNGCWYVVGTYLTHTHTHPHTHTHSPPTTSLSRQPSDWARPPRVKLPPNRHNAGRPGRVGLAGAHRPDGHLGVERTAGRPEALGAEPKR